MTPLETGCRLVDVAVWACLEWSLGPGILAHHCGDGGHTELYAERNICLGHILKFSAINVMDVNLLRGIMLLQSAQAVFYPIGFSRTIECCHYGMHTWLMSYCPPPLDSITTRESVIFLQSQTFVHYSHAASYVHILQITPLFMYNYDMDCICLSVSSPWVEDASSANEVYVRNIYSEIVCVVCLTLFQWFTYRVSEISLFIVYRQFYLPLHLASL